MFKQASMFDADLSSWNLSSIGNIVEMFYDTPSFTADLADWAPYVVGVQIDSALLASGIPADNIPLWCTVASGCSVLQGGAFESEEKLVSAVRLWSSNMDLADRLYGDISLWNTEKITSFVNLAWGVDLHNADLSKWNTSRVTNMLRALASPNFNSDISK